MSEQRSRMHGLDLLRALAIVAVVVYHLQGVLPPVLATVFGDLGWMGVDLFFALSGFLIGGQVLRPFARGERLRMGDFYARRAYRILPAYLVVLLLYRVWPMWREQPVLPAMGKMLTFTENLWMNFPAERAFSHAWSLCVEEHFYLVLPLLVAWGMRRASLGKTVGMIVAVVVFGVAVRSWELFHVVRAPGVADPAALFGTRIYYPTWSRLDGLVAGVAVALVQVFRPVWWASVGRRANAVFAVGLAVWGAAVWTFRGQDAWMQLPAGVVFGFPVMAAGFGLMVAAAATGQGILRWRIPGVGMVAAMAFSLYLTHKEVAHVDRALLPWMEGDRGWAAAAVYGGTCAAVGAALYFGVERPFLRLRDRRSGRPVTSREVAVEARLDPAL